MPFLPTRVRSRREAGREFADLARSTGYVGGRTLQEETEEFMTTSYRIMQLGPFSALQFGSQAMAVLSEEKKTIRGAPSRPSFVLSLSR